METKLNLTVIFTTYNEEHNIGEAVESVLGWADEIIVVDSFSTDDTLTILKKYDVKILQRKYLGPADQKNWAIPHAKNEWVLLMDADERATLEMRAEITNILMEHSDTLRKGREKTRFDCYWIGFRHYFMDKPVNYSGWQNDKTIRLIRRDVCRYNDKQVHEEIKRTSGMQIGFLSSKFEHYTFKDLHHFIAKQERYANWSALDHEKKTGRVTYFHLFIKPFARFLKHFVIKRGFLDGHVGVIIASVAAWSVFLRYVKIIENRRCTQQNTEGSSFGK
jgi:glycosyltransferase involved in cell wall biosynthesis